jgi:hypothetical protein
LAWRAFGMPHDAHTLTRPPWTTNTLLDRRCGLLTLHWRSEVAALEARAARVLCHIRVCVVLGLDAAQPVQVAVAQQRLLVRRGVVDEQRTASGVSTMLRSTNLAEAGSHVVRARRRRRLGRGEQPLLLVRGQRTHCTRYVCAVKPRPAAQPCGLPPAAAAFARPLAVKLS